MDLLKMSKRIENQQYRCWEAFFADIKWIVHNTKARKTCKKCSKLKFLLSNFSQDF